MDIDIFDVLVTRCLPRGEEEKRSSSPLSPSPVPLTPSSFIVFSRFTLEISPIFFRFFLKAGFFNKDSGPPSSEGGSYNFVRCQLWYPDTFGASLFQFFGLLSDRPQSRSPSAPGNRRRSVSHRPANLPMDPFLLWIVVLCSQASVEQHSSWWPTGFSILDLLWNVSRNISSFTRSFIGFVP